LWLFASGCQQGQQSTPTEAKTAAKEAVQATVEHMSKQMKEAGAQMPGGEEIKQKMQADMQRMIPPEYRQQMGGGGPAGPAAQQPQQKPQPKPQPKQQQKKQPAKQKETKK